MVINYCICALVLVIIDILRDLTLYSKYSLNYPTTHDEVRHCYVTFTSSADLFSEFSLYAN